MPCTYSEVDIRERERRAEEDKKKRIEKKKKDVLTTLVALGFEIDDAQSAGPGKTFFRGTKKEENP